MAVQSTNLEGQHDYTPLILRRVPHLLAALLPLLALTACSGDDDPNKATQAPALKVETGACLLVEDDLPPEVTKLPVIDCDKPHTHEIFDSVDDDKPDVFPGLAALEDFAQKNCYATFQAYVGTDPFDSALFITWIVPSLDSWNSTEKDRTVLCVLGRRDSGELTTSAKGLKI